MMMMMIQDLDMTQLVQRVMKYLIEGLAVAIAAVAIPKRQLAPREIAMIAAAGASMFAILDMYAPEVAAGARKGAGMGIGAKHVGY